MRLVEVALGAGSDASYLVDYADDIEPAWLDGVTTVGVTSGASVPEVLVRGVLDRLAELRLRHGAAGDDRQRDTGLRAAPRDPRGARTRRLLDVVLPGIGLVFGGAWPSPVLGSLLAVVGPAVPHSRDRVVAAARWTRSRWSRWCRGRFEGLEAVEPAVPVGPLVAGTAGRSVGGGCLRGSRADDRVDDVRCLRRGSGGGSVGSALLRAGRGRRGRSATGSMISVSGGRACRERDGCVRLVGRRSRALAVPAAGLPVLALRSIECCLVRRGAGASSMSSSSPSRASSAGDLGRHRRQPALGGLSGFGGRSHGGATSPCTSGPGRPAARSPR